MKIRFNKLWVALLAPVALAACNLSDINDGETDNPVWPKVETTFNKGQGTFPDLSSLSEVKKGMTKDQLYYLLGRPHHGEGFFGVKEWDYTFHFHTPGQGTNDVTTCQFKVLFDNDSLTKSFFWNPVDPVDATCGQPVSEAPQVQHRTFNLGADALFGFDKDKIQPQGRAELDKLLQDLRNVSDLQGITVTGYTDRIGTDKYNLDLSQRRANAVKNYLVQGGLPANLVTAVGKGKSRTAQCSGSGASLKACLQPDRKVVVDVKGTMRTEVVPAQ